MQLQNVIAGNIANVETPNYKPRELSFEKAKPSQSALGLMPGEMTRTEGAHMPTAFRPDSFGPEWIKR